MGSDQPTEKRTLSKLLIGAPRDFRDPKTFHSLSLVAFLAWIGLGSDGLSSSCYGPEEAFLALGPHQYLAVFLAVLMALTVFIISASYSQTIDEFPAGGGGYLVATKLLGRYPGLVSGSALIVDYVLTISISIASGADAIFSLLPVSWLPYRFWVAIAVVIVMVAMNLRGIKESVIALLPIFLLFVVLHVLLVTYAFISRAGDLPVIVHDAVQQVHQGLDLLGVIGLAIVFFRAYSMGAGTYTGIEAVSNGLPIFARAPDGYRQAHHDVHGGLARLHRWWNSARLSIGRCRAATRQNPERGAVRPFDQQLASRRDSSGTTNCHGDASHRGRAAVVAAQTGFVGGPQVLATMAIDRWVPETLRQSQRTSGDAGRCSRDGSGGFAGADRNGSAGSGSRRPLCDQRLRNLHPFATWDERPLVA